jgi:YYY domain-containing protein
MIWHGLQKLASPAGIEGVSFFQRIAWTIQGIGKFLNGASLPYSAGDWYWIPSRVYPGEPITEFPAFTFLYADLHAHLIDLPITVMALCWGLSLLKTRWEWPSLDGRLSFLAPALTFLAGAVTIGAIRPTNTWDLPVYLVLALLAVGYTSLRYAHNPLPQLKYLPAAARKWVVALASIACFTLLTLILYQPFSQWYGQGYNSIALWKGDHSPFWSYITHWGLFLFIIISWLFWETRDWMASTPASSLNKLKPFQSLILTILALLVIAVVALLIMGVGIAWMVLPVAAWACVLIFRPNQPDVKRAVLFMVGTALLLTLAVEVIVLEGDIGRMNTVFKFYLQAWTLLSISAGAALIWLVPAVLEQWNASWRSTFQVGLAVLVGCAALFPLLGGLDKIRDRITSTAPHTLDGMAYMEYANYPEDGVYMSLSQDYDAIQWMQDNIQGSPVIVEANTPEYRWGTRYTIYTGLPGVVGWNWHQRQQRAVTSSTWVTDRVAAVGDFYQTLDRQETISFLQKYQVQYIVVGQLEKIVYTGSGIDKFINWNDDLWHIVYQKDDTTIYQVNTIISDGFLTTSK